MVLLNNFKISTAELTILRDSLLGIRCSRFAIRYSEFASCRARRKEAKSKKNAPVSHL